MTLFNLLDSPLTVWVVALILFAFTGYNMYRSIQLTKSCDKALAEFQIKHKHMELNDASKRSRIIDCILIVICVVMIFLTGNVLKVQPEQLNYYRLAYVVLIIIFATQLIEIRVRKQVWYSDDGFFYMGKFYRFRMITGYEKHRSIVPMAKVLLGAKDELLFPNNMAVDIKHHAEAWKVQRKAEKKARRG